MGAQGDRVGDRPILSLIAAGFVVVAAMRFVGQGGQRAVITSLEHI